MLRLFLLITLWSGIFIHPSFSQKDPLWDDTKSKSWPAEAERNSVPSSADGSMQQVMSYKARSEKPRPLIVSLHTWGGDYLQKDTLVYMCIERDYNYIHPDFRGPNNKKEACGSDLVVSDIDDAISWALTNTNSDPDNIHIIGVSGGGFATVLAYMRSRHKIRSFSAYAGIYDLVDWYHESQGRKAKYAEDIARATSGKPDKPDLEEARRRSPFFIERPRTDRSQSQLNLYCGVHDGYTGSVPITHTLKMYNKLVKWFAPGAILSMIPEEYIQTMLRARSLPGATSPDLFLKRKIIYQNHYEDKLRLLVFEGGHEMPPGDALSRIPAGTILALGDSNGALPHAWPLQLTNRRPQDRIINACISGNTIGFNNAGRADLNSLKSIDSLLSSLPTTPDRVVIMLGTNDCKAEFAGELKKVPANLEQLIKKIKMQTAAGTQVYLVSPPPYGPDATLTTKYKGGAKRVEYLSAEFLTVAEKTKSHYIDIYSKLKHIFPAFTYDGIHLNQEGQSLVARIIDEELNKEVK